MISEALRAVQHAILVNLPLSGDEGASLRAALRDPNEIALLTAAELLSAESYEESRRASKPFVENEPFLAAHPLGAVMAIAHARALFRMRMYSDTVTTIEQLQQMRTSFTDEEQLAVAHVVGSACLEDKRYEEAFSHFTVALKQAELLHDQRLVGLIELDLSNVAMETGDYVKAMTWLQQALLHFNEAVGVEAEIAKVKINLAVLYIRLGRLEDARREYEELVTDPLVMSDPINSATTLLNYAITLKRLKEAEHSLETYKRALAMAQQHSFFAMVIRALIGIADHYKIQGDLTEAQQWIDQAQLEVQSSENDALVALVTAHAAHILHLMGQAQESITMMRRAYQRMVALDIASDAMDYGIDLAEWLAEAGQTDEAYRVQRECFELQQKINAKEFERSIELNELRSRLDQERRIIRTRDEERNRILHSMMPSNIAQRLVAGEQRIADQIPSASVMFADIVGFTALSSHTEAKDLVLLLEELFSGMDEVGQRHGCQRVKTIGDAYMAICGASEPLLDHPQRIVRAALEFLQLTSSSFKDLQVRVGINTGPVVAGVMRGSRIAYDVWGDTVNVASRMEELSRPGSILVTGAVAEAVRGMPNVILEQREPLTVRGKGLMETYWIRSSV